MKILGYWLIVVGVIYLLIAFNLDVSVSTPSTYLPGVGSIGGGDVANLDLMAQRQNHLMVAALITLIGALMAIFGKDGDGVVRSEQSSAFALMESSFSGDRDLQSDPYRLWLANNYRIERNEVFGRFQLGEQTFESLEDALAHAHSLEVQKIADQLAEEEQRRVEQEAKATAAAEAAEKAQAEWAEQKPKIAVGAVIGLGLLIGAIFVFRETPEERASRLAREAAERTELIEDTERRFGISLPEDVSQIKITENAATYDFLCNDRPDGTLLKFRTNLSEEKIQKLMAKKLGVGEAKYEQLAGDFDWKWRTKGVNYELSMLVEGPPTEVNFCMIK